MKTSIFSLLMAAALSVTGIHSASATNSIASGSRIASNNSIASGNSVAVKKNVSIYNIAGLRYSGEPVFRGSENFAKAFPNAIVTSYERTKDGRTKVVFSWNGDALEAFYDLDGSLIATSHFLDTKNLPISVQMKIRDKYKDYSISQALEFYHMEKGVSYFVMIRKEEAGLILQVDTNGGIEIVKKLKN